MDVQIYDGRTGKWRTIDAPVPLQDELVLSKFIRERGTRTAMRGYYCHDVYKRIGDKAFAFIGTAPTEKLNKSDKKAKDWFYNQGNSGLKGFVEFITIPWNGYLHPYWVWYRRPA